MIFRELSLFVVKIIRST